GIAVEDFNSVIDAAGDTEGHVAARHRHRDVLRPGDRGRRIGCIEPEHGRRVVIDLGNIGAATDVPGGDATVGQDIGRGITVACRDVPDPADSATVRHGTAVEENDAVIGRAIVAVGSDVHAGDDVTVGQAGYPSGRDITVEQTPAFTSKQVGPFRG